MPPAITASPHRATPSRAYCTAPTSHSPRSSPSLAHVCPRRKNSHQNDLYSKFSPLIDFQHFRFGGKIRSRQKGEHGGVTRVSHHPRRSHCGADSGPRRDAGQEGGDGQTGGPYYPNAVSGFVQGIITAVFTLRTMAERRHSLSRGELRTIPHKAKRLERTPQASTYIVLHDIMATLPPNTAHNPADESDSFQLAFPRNGYDVT